MFAKSLRGCLLLGLALAPLPVYGQSIREENSDRSNQAAEEPVAGQRRPDLSEVIRQIVRQTNEFRRQHGRKPLKVNHELTRAAQYFAGFMARTDKYGHTADGKQPWERMTEQGYDYCIAAENIAFWYNSEGFSTRRLADDFVRGWEKSPPHRKNMLDPDLTEIGVGVAHSGKSGKYYAVQDFGRPKSDAVRFEITNRTKTTLHYTLDGKEFSIKPRYIVTVSRCRPPKLQFRWPAEEGGKAKESRVFHPRKGAQYVIRRGKDGGYRVEQS